MRYWGLGTLNQFLTPPQKALCGLVLTVFQFPIYGSNSKDKMLHFNYSIT